MTTPPIIGCIHNDFGELRCNMGTDYPEFIKDLSILTQGMSNQVKKKALARLRKRHSRYLNPQSEESVFVALLYSQAAEALLKGQEATARTICMISLTFQEKVWKKNDVSYKEVHLSMAKVMTGRGLVLHVASRIPCGCLKEMKKEVKKQPKTAYCKGCESEKLFDDMLWCSGCKMNPYCSRECQVKDWNHHEGFCAGMRCAYDGDEK